MNRWININNKYVQDLAHTTLGDDATVQQQNIKLLADNRRLRGKTILLARKYGKTAKALKEKPVKNKLNELSLLVGYTYEMMRRCK